MDEIREALELFDQRSSAGLCVDCGAAITGAAIEPGASWSRALPCGHVLAPVLHVLARPLRRMGTVRSSASEQRSGVAVVVTRARSR